MSKLGLLISCLLVCSLTLTGCFDKNYFSQNDGKTTKEPPVTAEEISAVDGTAVRGGTAGVQAVSKPEAIPVLVNKHNKLPDEYEPSDLIYPDIPFTFEGKAQKRKMRMIAAAAIEKLFAGAKREGIDLLGVSAYRSHAAQTTLFNYYVKLDGFEKAQTYSALPGTSEHETGLAIDVTGGNGKCAAEDCFAGTDEAVWLEDHAAKYGFIIRYPQGKEEITGYQYEPWHLRYVGKTIAKDIMSRGITLEEYYNGVPVNN